MQMGDADAADAAVGPYMHNRNSEPRNRVAWNQKDGLQGGQGQNLYVNDSQLQFWCGLLACTIRKHNQKS